MSELQARIIEQIRLNRISTTEIADCMNKSGAISGIRPLTAGHFRVGPVFFAYAYNQTNYELHEQLRELPYGHIVIAEALDCEQRALFGSLVSKYIMLYRKAEAIVTDGYLRDASRLIKERWPIWCKDVTPIGCFNRKSDTPAPEAWLQQRRELYEGAIAVCDDSGVVVIPQKLQTEEFLEKLAFIEKQEDIWFFCIDTLKWDTFRTVCKKEYKNDPDLMKLIDPGEPNDD